MKFKILDKAVENCKILKLNFSWSCGKTNSSIDFSFFPILFLNLNSMIYVTCLDGYKAVKYRRLGIKLRKWK